VIKNNCAIEITQRKLLVQDMTEELSHVFVDVLGEAFMEVMRE